MIDTEQSRTIITDVLDSASDAGILRLKDMGTSNKLGRPASFDKEAALDVAMRLFWERGYEGTSMTDLSQAMGIHPSSIYAAFGDKQALFALSAKRYIEVPGQYMARALAEPTFEKFLQAAFYNTVEFLGGKEYPASCFTLTGSLSCGVDTEPAKALMLDIRLQGEAALKSRLLKARRVGEFSREENIDDYTRYLSSLLSGLAVQAANGSTKAQLKRTAELALKHLGMPARGEA